MDEHDDSKQVHGSINPRVKARLDIYTSQHRFASSRGHDIYLSVSPDTNNKPAAFKIKIGPGQAELNTYQMYDLFKHLQRYYFRQDGD